MESPPQSLVPELVTMINRINDRHMRRLRIAVTQDELKQIKTYMKQRDPESLSFVHALRGLPLYVEEYPFTPLYYVESV